MKNPVFYFALIITTFSYSQYIPILDNNNLWSVEYDTDFNHQYFVTYFVNGEEIINNKVYKIVYVNNVETECRWREENGILYTSINTKEKPRLKYP